MKRFQTEPSTELSDEEKETIESLLNYPSLEKVFDQAAPQNQAKIRQDMTAAVAALERVVRRGAKADAEKASRIIEAYQTTLRFLEELERRRQASPK